MKSRLLLNVVVGEGAAVLELLPGKDETLLIGGNAFLVLDLGFDVVDGVRWLDIERDGLACKLGCSKQADDNTRCVPADGIMDKSLIRRKGCEDGRHGERVVRR